MNVLVLLKVKALLRNYSIIKFSIDLNQVRHLDDSNCLNNMSSFRFICSRVSNHLCCGDFFMIAVNFAILVKKHRLRFDWFIYIILSEAFSLGISLADLAQLIYRSRFINLQVFFVILINNWLSINLVLFFEIDFVFLKETDWSWRELNFLVKTWKFLLQWTN